jgi:hypothetical protein
VHDAGFAAPAGMGDAGDDFRRISFIGFLKEERAQHGFPHHLPAELAIVTLACRQHVC